MAAAERLRTTCRSVVALATVLMVLASGALPARAQMPDIRQMSGTPLPSAEMPDGVVSVRVVRESLANNLTGVTVTLSGDGVAQSAETDAQGRAIFSGMSGGAAVRASVAVAGETVTSQTFPIPARGGVRLILALGVTDGSGSPGDAAGSQAGASSAAPADGSRPSMPPAVPGRVVLGAQTRTIVEILDGALEVFHVFEIANVAEGPVDVGAPIEFQMPEGARTVTLLEGSTPQARVFERKLVVAGPFAPGRTMVQVAYRLSYEGPTASLSLALPLPLIQTNLIVRKLGEMQVVAPSLPQSRDAQAEGRTYFTGTGPGLKAGDALTVSLDGLPYHSRWPRYTALTLAALVVAVGAWFAVVAPVDPRKRLAALESRRARLLTDIQRLDRLDHSGDHEVRRARLVDELEGVYAMIDAEQGRGPVAPDTRAASSP